MGGVLVPCGAIGAIVSKHRFCNNWSPAPTKAFETYVSKRYPGLNGWTALSDWPTSGCEYELSLCDQESAFEAGYNAAIQVAFASLPTAMLQVGIPGSPGLQPPKPPQIRSVLHHRWRVIRVVTVIGDSVQDGNNGTVYVKARCARCHSVAVADLHGVPFPNDPCDQKRDYPSEMPL